MSIARQYFCCKEYIDVDTLLKYIFQKFCKSLVKHTPGQRLFNMQRGDIDVTNLHLVLHIQYIFRKKNVAITQFRCAHCACNIRYVLIHLETFLTEL